MFEKKKTLEDVRAAMEEPKSIKVISEVLSKNKGAPKTIADVHAAANKIKYPFPANRKASSNKKPARIGVCFPEADGAYYLELTSEIRSCGDQANFEVIEQLTPDSIAQEKAAALFRDVGVVAVVLVSSRISDSCFRSLADSGVLVIGIGSPRPAGDFGDILIEIDHHAGMMEAARFLIELGHKRIGYFSGPETSSSNTVKRNAVKKTLEDAGLILCEQHIFRPGKRSVSYEVGAQFAQELLELTDTQRPTAVLCYNDELAIGGIGEFSRQHIKVPDDISIIGYDDIKVSKSINPRLTTVGVTRDSLVISVVEIIKSSMTESPLGKENLTPVFSTILKRRSSTGAIKNVLATT